MSRESNKKLIDNFIEEIWNKQNFEKINDFLHQDYKDNSLPPSIPNNIEGLKMWINGTSKAFNHQTVIEDQVTEENKSIIKITMNMTHIGEFHGLAATNKEVSTKGYRTYYIKNGKISEHWALIDGATLEKQIKSN